MLIKIIIMFTLISCNKEHELHKKNGLHFLKQVSTEISSLSKVPWDIGKRRETEVSKGIRITSTLPRISDKSKRTLKNNYGVDSWLIKLSRMKRGFPQSMGYFIVHFDSMSRTTKDFTINLYYHAAAVSKTFRLFHCPAFGHRLSITSSSLEKRSNIKNKDIYIRLVKRFPGKTNKLGFTPMVISGGKRLSGKYFIDLALYNSSKKQRYSDWSQGENLISINQEQSKAVASCNGVKEELTPLPESKLPSIRDLEIKK